MKNKKGQNGLSMLTGGAIAVLVLIIVLIVTFAVTSSLKETFTDLSYSESIAMDNLVWDTLTRTSTGGITSVVNASTTLGTGNYSYNSTANEIILLSTEFNASTMTVTYPVADTDSQMYNATVDAETGLSNIPSFLPVLIVVMVAVVILMLVGMLKMEG